MSNTAVAKRVTFSTMISTEKYQNAINRTLRDPARARRFVAAITSAVAINPALQECNPATILSGALLGESLNLSPSPQLGQYYLVPFKQKEKRDRDGNIISPECTNAQFVLGYKGMIQLALRSGQYKRLNVVSVKDGELHGWNSITEDFTITPIEDENEREKARTVGYLASFEYLNGFTKTIYWSREKMEAHALRYSKGYAAKKGYTFWEKDFDAMAYKTMLRQLISKWGIMSIEMQQALDGDGAIVAEDGEYIHTEEAEFPPPDEPDTAIEDQEETPAPAEDQVNLSDL